MTPGHPSGGQIISPRSPNPRRIRELRLVFACDDQDRTCEALPGSAIAGLVPAIDVKAGAVIGAHRCRRRGRERPKVGLAPFGVDRRWVAGPAREHVIEDCPGIGKQQALRERCRLGKQVPGPVAERWPTAHALELVDGGHDVEHGRVGHALGVIEPEPVRDPSAAVVADDGELLVAETDHQLDQLRGHISLRIPLALRPAGRGLRSAVAPQIRDDDPVRLG
jgi:hypothetical protein